MAEHLKAVYAAKSAGEIAEQYDAWADEYEGYMAGVGYRHPSITTALCARHLPAGSAPILDAGAGTGLVGEWLRLIGYPRIEALDISDGMLAVAEKKGVYDAFHRCLLGEALPFADGQFKGIVSAGVLTTGHVGAEALPELVRSTAEGGVLVLTVKETLWVEEMADRLGGFGVELVDATEPYLSMPGEPITTPSRAVCLRRI
ncbi:MAG: class I SAM-dependent methyltransferase [Pseudomonadota bacterium]